MSLDGETRQPVQGINGGEVKVWYSCKSELSSRTFIYGKLFTIINAGVRHMHMQMHIAYCICICKLQQEWGSRWSPLLLQSFTRSTSFLRFPSQHFNCCFNWSTVCSSGSLSSLEPGMTSPSVGKKCREVISAKRYWYQRTAADEGEDRLVHEGGGGRHSTSPLSNKDYNTAWPCSFYST